MEIKGWMYYNHAMLPTCAPHEKPNLEPVLDGSFWRRGGKALLARWTTEFDCGHATEWWYVIKDTPFDSSALKAKRRYEITKGNRNFEVRVINPVEYEEEICQVYKAALADYPAKYRPMFDEEEFRTAKRKEWADNLIYGGISKDSEKLCGYALLTVHRNYAAFNVLKTIPSCEKYGINAALVYGILNDFNTKLKDAYYICDGERNISHETQFQNYLEKYFGFRKAYCILNISYRPIVAVIVKILYPFRAQLEKADKNSLVHNVIAVLHMEELRRKQS